ncbi:MAG: hypothetical protein IK062_01510 [Selenomonadaceae bacterium]|nr:hypothetical protein [Selenomonadaceae bacterium]
MKRRMVKKLGMNEKKYALCLMLAGFAALNTGFTSQSDEIQSAETAQVLEVEQVPSESTQVEEKSEIENTLQEEKGEPVENAAEIETVEEPAVEDVEEESRVAYASVMSMEASAYLPTDGSGSGYTATGMRAAYGVAAVDPSVIPLGTRLYIPGYGEAIAADTGGAIRGYKIDLCMESYSEAMNFGRRNVTVYVLDD